MAEDLKTFALAGYASALFNALTVFFAPNNLLADAPMSAAGLVLAVLAWVAATKWRIWLGWLLIVIAMFLVPAVVGGALFFAALVWSATRGHVWPIYLLVLCSLLDIANVVLFVFYPTWLADFVAAHGQALPYVSVWAKAFNTASAISLIIALWFYFRDRKAGSSMVLERT